MRSAQLSRVPAIFLVYLLVFTVLHAAEGKPETTTPQPVRIVPQLAWKEDAVSNDPTGKYAVSYGSYHVSRFLYIIDRLHGRVTYILPTPKRLPAKQIFFAFSNNGSQLLFSKGCGMGTDFPEGSEAYALNLKYGVIKKVAILENAHVIAFSPDDKYIYFAKGGLVDNPDNEKLNFYQPGMPTSPRQGESSQSENRKSTLFRIPADKLFSSTEAEWNCLLQVQAPMAITFSEDGQKLTVDGANGNFGSHAPRIRRITQTIDLTTKKANTVVGPVSGAIPEDLLNKFPDSLPHFPEEHIHKLPLARKRHLSNRIFWDERLGFFTITCNSMKPGGAYLLKTWNLPEASFVSTVGYEKELKPLVLLEDGIMAVRCWFPKDIASDDEIRKEFDHYTNHGSIELLAFFNLKTAELTAATDVVVTEWESCHLNSLRNKLLVHVKPSSNRQGAERFEVWEPQKQELLGTVPYSDYMTFMHWSMEDTILFQRPNPESKNREIVEYSSSGEFLGKQPLLNKADEEKEFSIKVSHNLLLTQEYESNIFSLYETANAKCIATFCAFDDDEWIIYTPDALWLGSEKALDRVAFYRGMELLDAEEVKGLNNPEEIRSLVRQAFEKKE
ncbi:MAG: hypothetical protein JXA52_01995 [Planctomycetes bacterium]|nr:hypothetical protein [Planctomycetota bacterium]